MASLQAVSEEPGVDVGDDGVALALRAWAPVHASIAAVLGEPLNARIYPDWAAEQKAASAPPAPTPTCR